MEHCVCNSRKKSTHYLVHLVLLLLIIDSSGLQPISESFLEEKKMHLRVVEPITDCKFESRQDFLTHSDLRSGRRYAAEAFFWMVCGLANATAFCLT